MRFFGLRFRPFIPQESIVESPPVVNEVNDVPGRPARNSDIQEQLFDLRRMDLNPDYLLIERPNL